MNIAVPARVQGYCGVGKRAVPKAYAPLAVSFAQATTPKKPAGFWASGWRKVTVGITGLLALVGVGCVPVGGPSAGSPPANAPTTQTVFHTGGIGISANGGTQTRIGNFAIGSDGRAFTHIGNFAIGSDGTTQTRIGNVSIGSDGSTTFHFGD